MPDPQVLYIVTAVVVLGLVGWVIVVLSRSDGKTESASANAAAGKASGGIAAKVNLSPGAKPRLHSHSEITDEAASSGAPQAKPDVEED